MRTLTSTQINALRQSSLTICFACVITEVDGTVLQFCDHDQDVDNYRANFGFDASSVATVLGGSPQAVSLSFLLSKQALKGITRNKLDRGQLDNAKLVVGLLDYEHVEFGLFKMFTGYVTSASYADAGTVTLSASTNLGKVRTLCADKFSQTCRADFGDSLCKVDLSDKVDGPRVYDQVDIQSFTCTADERSPDGYYNNGTVYFTTGDARDTGYEILTNQFGEDGHMLITLKVPLLADIKRFDHMLLYPGCDKVITSGCKYWKNTANFQGENFIADQQVSAPPPNVTPDPPVEPDTSVDSTAVPPTADPGLPAGTAPASSGWAGGIPPGGQPGTTAPVGPVIGSVPISTLPGRAPVDSGTSSSGNTGAGQIFPAVYGAFAPALGGVLDNAE